MLLALGVQKQQKAVACSHLDGKLEGTCTGAGSLRPEGGSHSCLDRDEETDTPDTPSALGQRPRAQARVAWRPSSHCQRPLCILHAFLDPWVLSAPGQR